MPPKRKRAEEVTDAPVRATRSTRSKTAEAASSKPAEPVAARKGGAKKGGGDPDAEPAPKKTRKTAPKATTSKTARKNGRSVAADDGDHTATSAKTKSEPRARKPAATPQPYSDKRAAALFKVYEDADAPGTIGPEGFEKLCTDMEVSMEGALPLVLAWLMHATEMAKFKESEWMKGTGELQASDVPSLSLVLHQFEDLLFTDKASGPLCDSVKNYGWKSMYVRHASGRSAAFKALYTFCFNLAKPEMSRNIDMDTASAFWSVLVAPRYPIMTDLLAFISEKGSYKGVNKDVWLMVLDFATTIKQDLSNYDDEGAWPTMLDDFATWKKSQKGDSRAYTDIDG